MMLFLFSCFTLIWICCLGHILLRSWFDREGHNGKVHKSATHPSMKADLRWYPISAIQMPFDHICLQLEKKQNTTGNRTWAFHALSLLWARVCKNDMIHEGLADRMDMHVNGICRKIWSGLCCHPVNRCYLVNTPMPPAGSLKVLHVPAQWVGIWRMSKTKIYNLETGMFSSILPFSKINLVGVILQDSFWWEQLGYKIFWREQPNFKIFLPAKSHFVTTLAGGARDFKLSKTWRVTFFNYQIPEHSFQTNDFGTK